MTISTMSMLYSIGATNLIPSLLSVCLVEDSCSLRWWWRRWVESSLFPKLLYLGTKEMMTSIPTTDYGYRPVVTMYSIRSIKNSILLQEYYSTKSLTNAFFKNHLFFSILVIYSIFYGRLTWMNECLVLEIVEPNENTDDDWNSRSPISYRSAAAQFRLFSY